MRKSSLAAHALLLSASALGCGSSHTSSQPDGGWLVIDSGSGLDGTTTVVDASSRDASRPPDAGHIDASHIDSSVPFDAGVPVEAGNPGQVDITFQVQASKGAHAISPYIYGVNDQSKLATAHATILRSGGNRLTASNWENNASNGGADYQYENDDYLCGEVTCAPNNSTAGAYLKGIVDLAKGAGAAALITVPIVDYVSADKSPGGDVRTGSGYLSTRFKQNKPAKGAAFAYPPDTTDAYVYQDEMVHYLKGAETGNVIRWELDNEPDLWSATHPEVHPVAVTYAELVKRHIDYATAIRAVDPTGYIIGPSNYGWSGYVNLQGATDAQANGDFINYWLDQMKAAETTAGHRLVDGLDLHWYPEATGGGVRIIDDGTGAAEVAAREQAPRSLWDTTYTETSWIAQSATSGPIYLIPRIQAKIAAHYPGTSLSFTEWNYGGGTDISGAIASADVLGIYGLYGVEIATLWSANGDEAFTFAAFNAFRSYDGAGGTFGDTSVTATTSDVPNSSIYASLMSNDASKMVLVAINKATTQKVAGIVINHSTVYSKANVYTITAGGGAKLVAGPALSATGTNAFNYTMPAQSVSVIVPAQ